MSTPLYELTGQILGLQHLLEDEENPLPLEVFNDTMDALTGDIEEKADGLLAYVHNLDADVAAIDRESKRLNARKAIIKNRQVSLRNYLRDNMLRADIKKIVCPLWSITLRKPTVVVQVDDLDALPIEYRVTTVSADKMRIKRALKAGKDVPGARLIDGAQGLLIK